MRYSVLAWAVSMLYVWGVRSEASTVTVAKNAGKGGDDWQIQPKGGNDWEIQPKGGDDWQIQPKQSSFVSCGEHILEPGTSVGIQSKKFPNQYPNRQNCVWTFKASASDSTISIDCATFNLKNSRRCRGDVLLLEDGNTLNNRFCGNLGTLSEGGDTDLLNIVFKTNRRGKAQGFSCVVSASGKVQTITQVTTDVTDISVDNGQCSKCGTVNRVTRIVGGVATEVNEYPWQAALVVKGTNQVFCGASLYNDGYVVTAAHCGKAITDNGIDVEVLLGAHELTSSTSAQQRISVERIINHESYDSSTQDNDIAVLKLATKASLNENVKPACLPSVSEDYTGFTATVSGWGTLSSGGSQPDVLQEVQVPVVSNSECQQSYGNSISENMLCAGYDAGGKDSCQGDSGGPLAVKENGKWVLAGVVSWGYGCAMPNYPGVYVRVTKYLDWLKDKTSEGSNDLCSGQGSGSTTKTPAATTVPSATSCKCGQVNRQTRIVGGQPTEIHEYPWQVALVSSSGSTPFCGASIISNQWILTAAHCAAVMTTSNMVVIGEHKYTSTSETSATERLSIAQIIVHPSYNRNTYDNDIALLKLTNPITFTSDNKIAPVCFPTSGELYSNVDATVTGWGTLTSGGSQPNTLYEVTVPTMTNDKCKTKYSSSGITSNMICAGTDAGGKDSCQGDSGGPMVTAGDSSQRFMVQIGVVSWGYGCADADYPGVYARVTNYLTWIEAKIAGSTTCPPPAARE